MAVTLVRPGTGMGDQLHPSVLVGFGHRFGPMDELFPSCPSLFSPHASTVWLDRRANPCCSPAAMAVTLLNPGTTTGFVLQGMPHAVVGPVSLPRPRSPSKFDPQDQTVPVLSRASPKYPPAAMAVTLLSPATTTGVERSMVVPSPSSPKPLAPQATTVPLPRSARLKYQALLAATATTFERNPTPPTPSTSTGVLLQGSLPLLHVWGPVVSPMPSWPNWLDPQAQTLPLTTARLS